MNHGLGSWIMDHGLGNFNMDSLSSVKNRATTIDPSLKFAEKLNARQKEAEQKLIENRLKKLNDEEVKMRKQIIHFKRQTAYHDQVKARKDYQDAEMRNWKDGIERTRQFNYSMNARYREENKIQINNARYQVLNQNTESGQTTKSNRKFHEDHLAKTRELERQQNYSNMADIYNQNKNMRQKRKFDSNSLNESVVRANKQEANNHKQKYDQHQSQISRLEQLEERMITSMQRTMQRRQSAISTLEQRSPSLSRAVQPRKAYQELGKDAHPLFSNVGVKSVKVLQTTQIGPPNLMAKDDPYQLIQGPTSIPAIASASPQKFIYQ